MATLRSLYTVEVTADVPNDLLPPKSPLLTGQVQQIAQDGGVTHGRSLVTLNWLAPVENEVIGGEFLGTATGGAESLETTYDPIVSGEQVYEMSNFGGGGRGDTTSSSVTPNKSKSITVSSTSNFEANDWIQVDGGGQREYFEIDNVSGTTLNLKTRVFTPGGFSGGATVREADALVKTGSGTHYTLAASTGVMDVVISAFTASNDIVIKYSTTLADLVGYTLLRNSTLFVDTSHGNVSLDGGTVVVSDAISSGATSFVETLSAAENGASWYYYLYAKDDEATSNRSEVAAPGPFLSETIPSIPQNLGKSVGDAAVVLSWDTLGPGASDGNTNGYNVYRNNGATIDPPNLLKLNAIVIPKAQLSFQDSAAGAGSGDRVSSGTVALPANGQFFTYVIEAEDTSTAWTTGTQNQSSGQGAQTIASQTP